MITVDGVTRPRSEWDDILNLKGKIVYHWYEVGGHDYAVERIKETMRYGYLPFDYARNHREKVICLETGEIFDSLKETSKRFGISKSYLSVVIKERRTWNGYNFRKLNE